MSTQTQDRPAIAGRVPLSFDFDGTLSKYRGFRWPATELDLTPVRQALSRGYAVHVLTVNPCLDRIADALRAEGIDAVADNWRDHPSMVEWHGGSAGSKVLVTNRKLRARAYIDDRGLHYRYGDNPDAIWAELDRRYPPPVSKRFGMRFVRALRLAGHALYVLTVGENW